MNRPQLWVVAGPNGAGKTTLVTQRLATRALGTLRILYRARSTRTSGTSQTMFVQPLTSEQAIAAVDEAVALHNAGVATTAAEASATSSRNEDVGKVAEGSDYGRTSHGRNMKHSFSITGMRHPPQAD